MWGVVLSWRLVHALQSSIYLLRGAYSAAAVHSEALCSHHRKPSAPHSVANKDTAISLPPYSQRVHLHVVQGRHVTTEQSTKRSLGLCSTGLFSSQPWSPFPLDSSHQGQLCMPTLGYHCLCPCGQGGKAAFQRDRAFTPRHEYASFFVVLYSFP